MKNADRLKYSKLYPQMMLKHRRNFRKSYSPTVTRSHKPQFHAILKSLDLLRICPQKDGMFIQLEKRTSKILLIAQAEYSTKA